MHPEDVAELVQSEFGDLQARLAASDLPVGTATLIAPTKIEIEFTARQQEFEMVGVGLALPGQDLGQFQQQGRRVPLIGRSSPRELVLAVGCDNWDGTPPSAELLRPDRTPLPAAEWPQDSIGRGIAIGHPEYARKFFCRPGFREYHSHPIHKDDPWDTHREGFSLAAILLGLLDDLAHRWIMEPA
jgi:hypothetical protein